MSDSVTIVTANADGQLGCAISLKTALTTAGILPMSQVLTVDSKGALKSVIKYADGSVMSEASVPLPACVKPADAVTSIKSSEGAITLLNGSGQVVSSTNIAVGICAGA